MSETANWVLFSRGRYFISQILSKYGIIFKKVIFICLFSRSSLSLKNQKHKQTNKISSAVCVNLLPHSFCTSGFCSVVREVLSGSKDNQKTIDYWLTIDIYCLWRQWHYDSEKIWSRDYRAADTMHKYIQDKGTI